MRRQVLEIDKISEEKERKESKIGPKLQTLSDKGKGRRDVETRGGWKSHKNISDWLKGRCLDEVQEEVSARISHRNEGDVREKGAKNWISSMYKLYVRD